MKYTILLSYFFLSGCSVWYGQRPECPDPYLKKIAVLPVMGAPNGHEYEFGNIFASELVQCPGIDQIVWPAETTEILSGKNIDLTSSKTLHMLAKDLGAQAVLSIYLIKFTMHDPASAIIHCDLILNNTNNTKRNNTKNIDRLGTLSTHAKKHIPGMISVEKIFNTESHNISRNIWINSLQNTDNICGLDRSECIKKIGSNFFRFISEETIRDIFSKLKKTILLTEQKKVNT